MRNWKMIQVLSAIAFSLVLSIGGGLIGRNLIESIAGFCFIIYYAATWALDDERDKNGFGETDKINKGSGLGG